MRKKLKKTEEHKQEFIDMQQWRAHAKEIAKEIINNNNTETNIL